MRIIQTRSLQRGDTIIEVMLAFTIFAVLAIGSISIMSRSMATAQRSLEITQVRTQMDAQADAIRFIHQQYINHYPDVNPQWKAMTVDRQQATASQFGLRGETIKCPTITGAGYKPFILNTRSATVWSATPQVEEATGTLPPYSQVIYDYTAPSNITIKKAYGIWVEAVPSPGIGKLPGFVDFHIRACWAATGSPVPMTLGTIVRLYEPLP